MASNSTTIAYAYATPLAAAGQVESCRVVFINLGGAELQVEATLVKRFTIKIITITPDNDFVEAFPDAAPIWVAYGQPPSGAMVEVDRGTATAIGAPPTADWEFNFTVPSGYSSVKVFCTAKVNGARVVGGSEEPLQIGFTFDAVGFVTGLGFK